MKLIKKRIYHFFLIICLILLTSCASQINGVLRQGGAANLHVEAALEPRITILIRSLQSMMGEAGSGLILDGPAISLSLAASDGVSSVSLENTGPQAIRGNIAVNNIEDFLSVSGKRFITYNERVSGSSSSGSIHIYLDKETAPELIAMLSSEAIEYLTALMAPAVLGEDISKDEYLMLVGSLYGRPIAGEISTSMIRAIIEFPGSITSIRGGTANRNQAVFTVPLLDLLVLETPISLEAGW